MDTQDLFALGCGGRNTRSSAVDDGSSGVEYNRRVVRAQTQQQLQFKDAHEFLNWLVANLDNIHCPEEAVRISRYTELTGDDVLQLAAGKYRMPRGHISARPSESGKRSHSRDQPLAPQPSLNPSKHSRRPPAPPVHNALETATSKSTRPKDPPSHTGATQGATCLPSVRSTQEHVQPESTTTGVALRNTPANPPAAKPAPTAPLSSYQPSAGVSDLSGQFDCWPHAVPTNPRDVRLQQALAQWPHLVGLHPVGPMFSYGQQPANLGLMMQLQPTFALPQHMNPGLMPRPWGVGPLAKMIGFSGLAGSVGYGGMPYPAAGVHGVGYPHVPQDPLAALRGMAGAWPAAAGQGRQGADASGLAAAQKLTQKYARQQHPQQVEARSMPKAGPQKQQQQQQQGSNAPVLRGSKRRASATGYLTAAASGAHPPTRPEKRARTSDPGASTQGFDPHQGPPRPPWDVGVAPGTARARRSARVAGVGKSAPSRQVPRDPLDPPTWCRVPQLYTRAEAGAPAKRGREPPPSARRATTRSTTSGGAGDRAGSGLPATNGQPGTAPPQTTSVDTRAALPLSPTPNTTNTTTKGENTVTHNANNANTGEGTTPRKPMTRQSSRQQTTRGPETGDVAEPSHLLGNTTHVKSSPTGSTGNVPVKTEVGTASSDNKDKATVAGHQGEWGGGDGHWVIDAVSPNDQPRVLLSALFQGNMHYWTQCSHCAHYTCTQQVFTEIPVHFQRREPSSAPLAQLPATPFGSTNGVVAVASPEAATVEPARITPDPDEDALIPGHGHEADLVMVDDPPAAPAPVKPRQSKAAKRGGGKGKGKGGGKGGGGQAGTKAAKRKPPALEYYGSILSCLEGCEEVGYSCSKCHSETAVRRYKPERAPDILVFQLSVFDFDQRSGDGTKLRYFAEVPEQFNLGLVSGRDVEYDLRASVCHLGTNLSTGHYTVYVKHMTAFYYIDNQQVVPVKDKSLMMYHLSTCSYLVFYSRKGPPQGEADS